MITVGDLKNALKGVPEDTPVWISPSFGEFSRPAAQVGMNQVLDLVFYEEGKEKNYFEIKDSGDWRG